MLKKLFLLFLLLLSQKSFSCEKITPEVIQSNNLNVLFHSINKQIKLDFSKYCNPNLSFNFSMIHDLDTLKIVEKQVNILKPGYEKQPFLLLLINSKFQLLSQEDITNIINLQKKLNNDNTNYLGNKISINEQSFNKNKEELINYLNKKYNNEKVYDSYGNSELIYSLISNNNDLFNYYVHREINKFKITTFDKKNTFGLTLYHMAFSPSLKGQKTEAVNEVLINLLHEEKLQNLSFNNLSFFEFAYLLKDNNPDFYKKILKKYKLNEKIISQIKESLHNEKNSLEILNSNAFKLFTDI